MVDDPRRRWGMTTAIFLLGVLACPGELKPAQAGTPGVATSKSTIVLGRVSSNPRKAHPRLEKMVEYLVRRLRPLGIKTGEVIIAKDNRDMIQHLKTGKVDFLSETVMSALLFQEKAHAEILLHEWKSKTGWYWSVMFTHKKNQMKKMTDLRGKKIAFEDPGSTTGFLLPLAILRKQGLEVVRLRSYRDPVPPFSFDFPFFRSC